MNFRGKFLVHDFGRPPQFCTAPKSVYMEMKFLKHPGQPVTWQFRVSLTRFDATQDSVDSQFQVLFSYLRHCLRSVVSFGYPLPFPRYQKMVSLTLLAWHLWCQCRLCRYWCLWSFPNYLLLVSFRYLLPFARYHQNDVCDTLGTIAAFGALDVFGIISAFEVSLNSSFCSDFSISYRLRDIIKMIPVTPVGQLPPLAPLASLAILVHLEVPWIPPFSFILILEEV